MAIEVRCPGCQSLLRIADENIGRKARCPSCSQVFTAEAAASSDSPAPSADAGQGGALPEGMPPVPGSQPAPSDDPGASPFGSPIPETNVGGNAFPGIDTNPTNPYAPTSSDAAAAPAGPMSHSIITLDDVFSKSWAIFKKHWAMICVVVLIVGAVNFGCSMFQNVAIGILEAAANEPAVTIGGNFLLTAVFWVLQIWLQLGQVMVILDVARGRPINISKLFSGGPFLLSGVVAMVLVTLAIGMMVAVLIGIPAGVGAAIAQAPEGALAGAGIGLLIGVVPIIFVSLAVSQIQPLIVDRSAGPIDAIRMSWDITQGNKFTLFLIGVVLFAIAIGGFLVGLLLLCVGVFPAMIGVGAFSSLVLVVAYLGMTGQTVVIPASPNDPAGSQYQNVMP